MHLVPAVDFFCCPTQNSTYCKAVDLKLGVGTVLKITRKGSPNQKKMLCNAANKSTYLILAHTQKLVRFRDGRKIFPTSLGVASLKSLRNPDVKDFLDIC